MPALPRLQRQPLQQLQRRLSAELARAADILERWSNRVAPAAPSVAAGSPTSPASPAAGAAPPAPAGAPADWLELVRTHAPELLGGGGIRVGPTDGDERFATAHRTPTVVPPRDRPATRRTDPDTPTPDSGDRRRDSRVSEPMDHPERGRSDTSDADEAPPRSARTVAPTPADAERRDGWMPMMPTGQPAPVEADRSGARRDERADLRAGSNVAPRSLDPDRPTAGPPAASAARSGIIDRVLDRVATRRARRLPSSGPGTAAPGALDNPDAPATDDRGVLETTTRTQAHREPAVPPARAERRSGSVRPERSPSTAATDPSVEGEIETTVDHDIDIDLDANVDAALVAAPRVGDRLEARFADGRAATSPRWPALPDGPTGRSDPFGAVPSPSPTWDPWPALPDDLAWFEPVGSASATERSADGRSMQGTAAGLWDHVADLDAEQRGR